MNLFRQEITCLIGLNGQVASCQKTFPLSDEAPLAYCTACVTFARTCGNGVFWTEKRSVPLRQTSKRNKFPYAWILITYMWIINMPHESKWSTHVCKWATHRDYSHINFWRPNLAAAEVNSNISIKLITLWMCQTRNKILQSYHYRIAFLKLQTHCQFL